MSYDLAKNPFEVNAKFPTVVDTVDTTILNMKVGKEFNHEQQQYHYGFSGGMGQVSENAEVVLGLVLAYLQIQGTADLMHIGFAADEQIPLVTDVEVGLGAGITVDLVWNGTNGNYESAEVVGLGALAAKLVGGIYPMTLTDTTV